MNRLIGQTAEQQKHIDYSFSQYADRKHGLLSLSDRGAVLENNIWDDRCISHVTLVKDISKIIMNKAQD